VVITRRETSPTADRPDAIGCLAARSLVHIHRAERGDVTALASVGLSGALRSRDPSAGPAPGTHSVPLRMPVAAADGVSTWIEGRA
jgi:hypothetical protein